MALSLILLILSFFLCILALPYLSMELGGPNKKTIGHFLLGLVINGIAIWCFYYCIMWFINMIQMKTSLYFMDSVWYENVFSSFFASLLEETVRFLLLLRLNRRGKWSSSTKSNLVLSFGNAWGMIFFNWGLFSCRALIITATGEFESLYLTPGVLFWGLLMQILTVPLYIGVCFITQYGLATHRKYRFALLALTIQFSAVFARSLVYYWLIPKQVIATVVYGVISAAAGCYGYRKLTKLHRSHHRHHRHSSPK